MIIQKTVEDSMDKKDTNRSVFEIMNKKTKKLKVYDIQPISIQNTSFRIRSRKKNFMKNFPI